MFRNDMLLEITDAKFDRPSIRNITKPRQNLLNICAYKIGT